MRLFLLESLSREINSSNGIADSKHIWLVPSTSARFQSLFIAFISNVKGDIYPYITTFSFYHFYLKKIQSRVYTKWHLTNFEFFGVIPSSAQGGALVIICEAGNWIGDGHMKSALSDLTLALSLQPNIYHLSRGHDWRCLGLPGLQSLVLSGKGMWRSNGTQGFWTSG